MAMWSTSNRRRLGVWLGIGLLMVAALISGCVATNDSDQPWTTQEPWEGTIPLPSGMMDR